MAKPKSPVIAALDLASQEIAQRMANSRLSDYELATERLRTIARTGDVNGVSVQACDRLLRLHGLCDPPGTKTTVKAGEEGGKMTFEIVHVVNPPPEDDD